MREEGTMPLSASNSRFPRRDLLKWLLGLGALGWLGSVFYPVIRYLVPPAAGEAKVTSMKIGNLDETWEEPFKIIQMGRTPIIVLKDQQDQIHALNATCTHLSCIVQYRPDDNIIWCACHNGKFDLSGKVISGPPPEPLESYEVNITENREIWISRKQS
jgi:cytochrome b6-f complex iron-sulfur subunit